MPTLRTREQVQASLHFHLARTFKPSIADVSLRDRDLLAFRAAYKVPRPEVVLSNLNDEVVAVQFNDDEPTRYDNIFNDLSPRAYAEARIVLIWRDHIVIVGPTWFEGDNPRDAAWDARCTCTSRWESPTYYHTSKFHDVHEEGLSYEQYVTRDALDHLLTEGAMCESTLS